ncbi:hypothetical protein BESB_065950 [Besnoitia besnoiti]|uniref:ATP-dependent Clp protease proteolytic subunit n=1 Tax=Besnoitia besnoiti TaxID=94643 RepID=A0A2A9MGN9_BESBE|nr:hypothetical protein BESB_065950 [Besnoitia besnoiti]PFH34562.1 hypothetical protein BESB_065950 [Besnoitia besnoiti]
MPDFRPFQLFSFPSPRLVSPSSSPPPAPLLLLFCLAFLGNSILLSHGVSQTVRAPPFSDCHFWSEALSPPPRASSFPLNSAASPPAFFSAFSRLASSSASLCEPKTWAFSSPLRLSSLGCNSASPTIPPRRQNSSLSRDGATAGFEEEKELESGLFAHRERFTSHRFGRKKKKEEDDVTPQPPLAGKCLSALLSRGVSPRPGVFLSFLVSPRDAALYSPGSLPQQPPHFLSSPSSCSNTFPGSWSVCSLPLRPSGARPASALWAQPPISFPPGSVSSSSSPSSSSGSSLPLPRGRNRPPSALWRDLYRLVFLHRIPRRASLKPTKERVRLLLRRVRLERDAARGSEEAANERVIFLFQDLDQNLAHRLAAHLLFFDSATSGRDKSGKDVTHAGDAQARAGGAASARELPLDFRVSSASPLDASLSSSSVCSTAAASPVCLPEEADAAGAGTTAGRRSAAEEGPLEDEKPFIIFFNSPGGSLSAGLALFDVIRSLKAPVYTVNLGMAASMASLLLAAGTPGRRFAVQGSSVLLHQPAGLLAGRAADLIRDCGEVANLHARVVRLYSQVTGQCAATVRRDMAREKVLNAEEACGYGLVDAVLSLF